MKHSGKTLAFDGHVSVLFDACMALIRPQPGGLYVDGTLGAGGHTRGLLERSAPDGHVFGFDRDPQALALARQKLGPLVERTTLIQANYASMQTQLAARDVQQVDGVLLDLGLSSMQLDSGARGFSFRFDAPLDMRFNPESSEPTAADLVNELSEPELADLFWRYGEEQHSRRLARLVVENRPLHTTGQLAELVAGASPRRGRLHPATKLFQALRIAVNDELRSLESGLTAALNVLRPGGRLAVISFHSLEDRIVKQRFRAWSEARINPPGAVIYPSERPALAKRLTRKPITPDQAELEANARSRSAKLRAVEKLALTTA